MGMRESCLFRDFDWVLTNHPVCQFCRFSETLRGMRIWSDTMEFLWIWSVSIGSRKLSSWWWGLAGAGHRSGTHNPPNLGPADRPQPPHEHFLKEKSKKLSFREAQKNPKRGYANEKKAFFRSRTRSNKGVLGGGSSSGDVTHQATIARSMVLQARWLAWQFVCLVYSIPGRVKDKWWKQAWNHNYGFLLYLNPGSLTPPISTFWTIKCTVSIDARSHNPRLPVLCNKCCISLSKPLVLCITAILNHHKTWLCSATQCDNIETCLRNILVFSESVVRLQCYYSCAMCVPIVL